MVIAALKALPEDDEPTTAQNLAALEAGRKSSESK
jgi:hypothetical protein